MRRIVMTLFVVLVLPFASCGIFRSHPPEQATAVPISTVESVAGEWKGRARRSSEFWAHGNVRVSIAPGGRYVTWSDRPAGMTVDAGRLIILDGKLVSLTNTHTSVFTLYQPHGDPILVVDVTRGDGDHYYAELTPDKP